jgi:hypothetical protein
MNFDLLRDSINLQRDVFDEGVFLPQYNDLNPGLKTLQGHFYRVGSCGQLRELIATILASDGGLRDRSRSLTPQPHFHAGKIVCLTLARDYGYSASDGRRGRSCITAFRHLGQSECHA